MRRIRFTFWALMGTSVFAAGILSRAIELDRGPAAGAAVASGGILLAVSLLLAARILVVVTRRAESADRDRHAHTDRRA
jgi:hypothetical protein